MVINWGFFFVLQGAHILQNNQSTQLILQAFPIQQQGAFTTTQQPQQKPQQQLKPQTVKQPKTSSSHQTDNSSTQWHKREMF